MLRLAAVLGLQAVVTGAAPQLRSDLTIYRDDFGVPHIVGETEEAAFFGYGYAQAEDHLEKMMVQYLDAQGRRAEVQGENALGDRYLEFIPYEYRWDGDYLQRLLRTKRGVVENREKIAPEVYRILDAFAQGVNAFIREHRSELPEWIEPITAEDVEALERSHYFRFYSIHDALIKMPEKPKAFPKLGSNHWAISKDRSACGRVIHVEHTHMPWANRFQNYEAHLIVPGKLYAGGISWFGSPFFLDGFNDKITWSATWNEPNIADIYEEKLHPENPLLYEYEGEWRTVRVERETFRIKTEGGFRTEVLPLYYTHHGPIVAVDAARGRAYSVKLPNFDGVNYSAGLYGLMKARNLDEFRAAVARQLMPRWNLLYTDAENIYWVCNGNVARRDERFDWGAPVPGWTRETEWGPYLPFELYPQLLNPPSGFLQNCNNPPWVATKNSGLKPLDPVPYFLRQRPSPDAGEEVLNPRGERLFQVLCGEKKFSVQEMIDLGFDTYVMAAEAIVPLLERAEEGKAASSIEPRMARAMERIRAWDRRSAVDSVAFTYVHFWAKSYARLFGQEKLARFISSSRKRIDLGSSEEQERAWKALEEALSEIERRYGKSEVPWGEINVVLRGGTFPLAGCGGFDVLSPAEGEEAEDGRVHCNDGWGHLMVVVEGTPKEIWSLLPYGQSEHPGSPHYNDQAKLHSQRKPKRFPFTPEEILARAKSIRGRADRLTALCRSDPPGSESEPAAAVTADFRERLGPMDMDRMALGQGGLSEEPMWDDRVAEIRALRPRWIRLFIQEYFDLLPERGRYRFEILDRSVETILRAGAKPLMCICFKPRVLFPEIRQDLVFPNDWDEWSRLIENLVRHYKERGGAGWYWEVANEPDIGEDGGCPYRFDPESYVVYYRRTVEAVLRADPSARVGGPALANVRSPILPALLETCEREKVPLHFVSWHIYSSDPGAVRRTIEYAKDLLKKHPAIEAETLLDEWNMDLMNPPSDPRFQPCYIPEVIWHMKEAGLDGSCYYHIRDFHVSFETFARILSPGGTAFMTRWWNRYPQYDGLFDFQNEVRPAYFSFLLLSWLSGERLAVKSAHPSVRGFLAHDERLRMHALLLWNFSGSPAEVELSLLGIPKDMKVRPIVLDAVSPCSREDCRLRHLSSSEWKKGDLRLRVEFEPWGVRFWSLE